MSDFVRLPWKTVLMHVGVGMGAASYWRGAWYVLDDHLFPHQPILSAASSLVLGTLGMLGSQGLVAKAGLLQHSTTMRKYYPVARFGAVYCIAMSCVFVWRGTWLGWDLVYEHYHNHYNTARAAGQVDQRQVEQEQNYSMKQLEADHNYEVNEDVTIGHRHATEVEEESPGIVKATDPGHATISGVFSHLLAITILCGTGLFVSILAPPAAASVKRDVTVKATQRVAGIFSNAMVRNTAYIPSSTTLPGLDRLHSLVATRATTTSAAAVVAAARSKVNMTTSTISTITNRTVPRRGS